MRLRGALPAALALVCAAWYATPSRPAPRPWQPPPSLHPTESLTPDTTKRRVISYVNDEPDTGQFLPDSVVLGRVEKRTISVKDYVESYFASYAEYRPRPDADGRLEFLNSMINKEVLGLTALSINRPLGFEDRAVMREFTERVLSNVLYQRAILDSIQISDKELQQVYEQHKISVHLRHIVLATRAEAERLRADLVAKRISWKDAVQKHSIAPEEDRQRDGDIGWKSRFGFDTSIASDVFTLKAGEISKVLSDAQGYQIVQVVEKNAIAAPSFNDIRPAVVSEVKGKKVEERSERLRAVMRNEIGMVYDTTNIEWACRQFTPTIAPGREGAQATIEMNTVLPEFAPADTSRVLARYRGGQLSLGAFLDAYNGIQPLMRPSVNDFDGMRIQVDAIVLEPSMAQLALRRGLDKDSMAVAQIDARREEIMVNHLYTDSVESKVYIRPEERKKYYQDNLPGYMTYPRVTYAAFVRPNRESADSLAAQLRGGTKAADVLRADSLAGLNRGSIQERSAREHGTPYYKLLFEELRPGKVATDGPDKVGAYAVIQLLTYDPGHQLKYEEVEHLVDESLQNIKAEARLKEFLARRKKLYKIEMHPELLARVRMVDPSLME